MTGLIVRILDASCAARSLPYAITFKLHGGSELIYASESKDYRKQIIGTVPDYTYSYSCALHE